MKILAIVLVIITLAIAASAAYVRLSYNDPAVWNVDPLTVTKPTTNNYFLVRSDDGEISGEVYQVKPQALLVAFNAVALATPRTTLLAGSVASGQITFVTRSAVWGFPDFTSVRAVKDGGGARMVIFARPRFGESDFGVNRARTEDWLSELGLTHKTVGN